MVNCRDEIRRLDRKRRRASVSALNVVVLLAVIVICLALVIPIGGAR